MNEEAIMEEKEDTSENVEKVEVRDDTKPSGGRTLDNTTNEGAVEERAKVVGTQLWQTVCKAWHDNQRWFKSTKAMEIEGRGVLVQTTTYDQGQVTDALQFIPDTRLAAAAEGCVKIVGYTWAE